MASSHVAAGKLLFSALGCLMLATLLYTLITDGSPFRSELLTPWMTATLVDFYINVVALSVWVATKESSWITSVFWIILLVCFGSITTCVYIVVQLFTFPSQDPLKDPVFHVLLPSPPWKKIERTGKLSTIVAAKILFSVLGCLMLATLVYTLLTDGSPFRGELLTPWMVATLVDFYVNVVAIAVWVAYKETTWIATFIWIVLLICFGSITTCAYIVIQLFQLSAQDPLYLFLLDTESRKQLMEKFKEY
eukprot:TRINITY_DN1114_c0_g1_i3.p1 TRINITY_DN1114_c0_g1~~TRINITY_DN1114_c0_g1_i3.p1  ORF type:complete len:249 (-),score=20.57 TRINITY_DN1114_c0_g1_i3:214-960(-)